MATTELTKDAVNLAMEQASGEPAHAAIILRCQLGRLEKALEADEELHSRWMVNRPQTVAETLKRSPLRPATAKDVEAAVRFADEQFHAKLRDLGMGDGEAQRIRDLQDLSHRFFRQTVEFLHGGLVDGFADLGIERKARLLWLNDLLGKLRDWTTYPLCSKERAHLLEEAKIVSDSLRAVGSEVLRANTVVQNSLFVVASQAKHKKQAKPGFSPGETDAMPA